MRGARSPRAVFCSYPPHPPHIYICHPPLFVFSVLFVPPHSLLLAYVPPRPCFAHPCLRSGCPLIRFRRPLPCPFVFATPQ